MTPAPLHLVADIGGTNSRLALVQNSVVKPDTIMRVQNCEYTGFDEILTRYLAAQDRPELASCCIALAGPVRGETAQLTNLGWQVNSPGVCRQTGAAQVFMINDLAALAYGLPDLKPDDTAHLFGPANQQGTRIVIGVGTGFNISVARACSQGNILIAPAESGHQTLPVLDLEMLELATYARGTAAYCSNEDILSGRGFETVYHWICARNGTKNPKSALEIWDKPETDFDANLRQAANLFLKILGGVVGDLCLGQLPFGGVYLAGGVMRRLVPYLQGSEFQQALLNKGCKNQLMPQFGVSLITDDFAALTGCARFLAQH